MSFLEKIFGRDPKDLFFEYDPRLVSWGMVTWNFDLKKPQDRQWMIEVHKENGAKQTIQWLKSDTENVSFFSNTHLIRKKKISDEQDELKYLMNLSIHSTLKASFEIMQGFMITQVSGATTADLQNEFRALQWVQASFGMVSRALESMKNKDHLILTAAFFSGIEPSGQDRVLRLIIFNLDIFFYLQTDNSLRIVIFDDKNLGAGETKNPSFQQIIKVTKPQFYDEIVKLVHQIATAGEVP